MPKKGHKAAARQAKLRDKKRHGKGAPQLFGTGPTEPRAVAEDADAPEEPERRPSPRRAAVATPSPGTARSPAQRSRAQEAPQYAYLGGELRRIAVVSTVIFALIAVASFVLGS